MIAALIAVLGVLWYAHWTMAGGGSAAVAYLFMPAGMLGALLAIRRMRRATPLEPIGRRFWRTLEIACWLLTAGYGILAGAAFVSAPELPVMPVPAVAFAGAGMVLAMWAVVRVPLGVTSWHERGKQSLDRLIALLGCGIVLWHFGLAPMVFAPEPWSTPVLAIILLAFLFAAGAITKVSYITGGPVDRTAVRAIAMTGLVAAVVAVAAVAGGANGPVIAQTLCLPMVPVLIAVAACRQRAAAGAPPRRSNIMLPYLAMLATDVAVAHVLFGTASRDETRVVVGASVMVTALVTVRQYLAFRANNRLLGEQRASEERMRYEATHDGLTGLANRALFRRRLDEELAAGEATVLLVDLDDFKTVNDSLGHDLGDDLLMAFAAALSSATGSDGEVARLGGDEFAVLVRRGEGEGLSKPGRAELLAERVMAMTAAPVGENRLLVHVSAGLASAPAGTAASALLRAADTAMHVAKERGKNNWVRYASGMEQAAQAHARLGGELRRGLDAGEFRVVYQPLVSLDTGRIIGAEALVRWAHPERGLVSPADFIPAAERTGLIVPLGRFVLRETCRQAAAWLAEFGPDALAKVAPNVSVRQLHDPDFVDDVKAALADSGLCAERLVLELTESAVLRGAQALRVLHELHDMGVRLALDDFGTGESSLSLLRAFPAAIVKLDKSFVDGIEFDELGTPAADARQAVARAVIQLAGALGLDTVAEGIENQEQADRLHRLGYTVGQGYHLGRPVPPEEITARFAAEAEQARRSQPAAA
ncbi:diguanylate cyclase (GGDEF)-like protein [Actinoplanes lutulentus]|uniref:Diguanylate cyclase (GGDEF)-like protein n=1 Tax=Actinoplanes lutulentus TaxID=1287878 RepID=A0A327ZJ05_9ACTN|nr:bifunctional diguanylate cyclase/phosphodiesterase [Actinoplanes lutulentus]RAK42623.1 diguanylate cyclase (GGDEF)-like protein [Actinoplanes lutulentus]